MEFNELAKLISEVINVPADKIRREQSLKKDLGADSLDVFQIVIRLEEETGSTISPADAEKLRTVGDLADMAEKISRKH